ncbi:MAG: class I SAM-dependent methyltransferase [Saccharofermentans sp.]|nr:class I SAM-dependent methyltransferase [Saccharofermentans sp.]
MKSKIEKKTQVRNALIASGISLIAALIAAALSLFVLNLGFVITFILSAIVFAAVLAVMLYLWKKTDLLREVLYLLYCIRNPEDKRTYYCPCCKRSLAGFMDMELGSQPEKYDPARFTDMKQDVMCPFCYSAPRQRILACWAEDNKELLKKSEILYFAPEYSMMKWIRRNGIKLTTADLFAPNVDLKLDITDIKLEDSSYDMIICNHVLEHVSSYNKALSEMRRVLRPGGTLVISFPIDETLGTVFEQEANTPEDRIKLFGQVDHIRVFGRDSKEIIASAGFDVDTIDVSSMPDKILPVTGPADYDSNKIFICTKN